MPLARFMRFGPPIVWALGAGGHTPSSEQHPLCTKFQGQSRLGKLQPLPAKYVCRGENVEGACSSAAEDVPEIALDYLEGKPGVRRGDSETRSDDIWEVETEPRQLSTWWVCEGHPSRSFQVESALSARIWVSCTGYFAVRGDGGGSAALCGESSDATIAGTALSHHHHHHLGRTAEEQDPNSTANVQEPTSDVVMKTYDFIHTSGPMSCHEAWTSWPAVHRSAMDTGTVLMFQLFPSIGNLFYTLGKIIKVVRFLEIGLVLDYRSFPGFREALGPSIIEWDLEPGEIAQRADEISQGVNTAGLHSFKFEDGVLLLSDGQLDRLTTILDTVETSTSETAGMAALKPFRRIRKLVDAVGDTSIPLDPCAWNLLFRRSPFLVETLAAHGPWDTLASPGYVAWHIRTSGREIAHSFNSEVHSYIFDGKPSSTVVPLYLSATEEAEDLCPDAFPGGIQHLPVFISSNSKGMTRNCSTSVVQQGKTAGFVDLGIAEGDSQTGFGKDPTTTAMNAFVHYFALMDASVIVTTYYASVIEATYSSFSGTVAMLKGLKCQEAQTHVSGCPSLRICIPSGC